MLFPTGPVVGQTYTLGLRIWRWNGAAWAVVINQGQLASVLVAAGPFVDTLAKLPGLSESFNLLTYTP